MIVSGPSYVTCHIMSHSIISCEIILVTYHTLTDMKTTLGLHIILLYLIFVCVGAKLDQCLTDCRQNSTFRLVGPTRPWHEKDFFGYNLNVTTRSYPYSMAAQSFDVFQFHITFEYEVILRNVTNDDHDVENSPNGTEMIKESFLASFTKTLKNATHGVSFDLQYISDSLEEEQQHNRSTFALKSVVAVVEAGVVIKSSSNQTKHIHFDNINNALQALTGEHKDIQKIVVSNIQKSKTIHAGEPNPYSEFCELGCAYYYALHKSDPFHVRECLGKCDDFYRYNVTIGYIDLIEVARLECRDGCHMGLMRCKPGHYCSQVQRQSTNHTLLEEVGYEGGGWMKHCPPGTYRDVSYDAVEECIPCPPGTFREGPKGTSVEACHKCPPGTYNNKNGSSTIQDCKRCPEGTFTNEYGSESCICITPLSCSLKIYTI